MPPSSNDSAERVGRRGDRTIDDPELNPVERRKHLRRRAMQIALVVLGAYLVGVQNRPFFTVAGALLCSYTIFRYGLAILGSFARPIPEPPPAGELRRVKIQFRCSICGTEVRMTTANDEIPEPPRHCLEDMDIVAPIEE